MAMDFMISNFATKRRRSNGLFAKENNTLPLLDEISCKNRLLPPEEDDGNIEYKIKLVNPSNNRMQHLITQLKWRLREGQGEAIYEIGVDDDGRMIGLTDKDLDASMRTLKAMASALHATVTVLSERNIAKDGESCRLRVVELLIRKVHDSRQFTELRIAVLGGANSGKSTLCGVMTQGFLDDGLGKARLNLFRYLHEFQTGRTSSVCLDVIGFDSTGILMNYSQNSLEEIVEHSTKLITLIDLAGDRRYMKTTIYGLTGYLPHYAALVVSANKGPISIAREHFGFAIALNIPVFVIVTKIDIVSKAMIEKLLKSISLLVKRSGVERKVKRIKNISDAVSCAASISDQDAVPVFFVSNVTGEDLYLLENFLNVLPQSGCCKYREEQLSKDPPLFVIDEVYRMQDVNSVVCGVLTSGLLCEKEIVRIGPFKNGMYRLANVLSIRRNRQPVCSIRPGDAASVAIELHDPIFEPLIRRGMVLANTESGVEACKRFTARLYLLFHPTTEICVGFQGTVYAGSVRQTATIIDLEDSSVKLCQWTIVQFQFYTSPEYICVGTPIIFRQGRTKGMGEVIQVFATDLIE